MSWSYDSLRDQLGTHPGRKLGKLAAAGTAGAVAAGGLVLGTATPAGAYLPAKTNMFKMGTTTAIAGAFDVGNWNAAEVSLGWSTYTTEGCPDTSGDFSELMTDIRNDIAAHEQVVAGIPVMTGLHCGGEAIGLTHWSTKVKNIVTSAKKDTGWKRYFGGVVLDEEGGFGYTIGAVYTLNQNLHAWFGANVSTDYGLTGATYLFTQVYAPYTSSWDNYSAYRTLNLGFRQMPQLYNSHMDTLVNGACQISTEKLACAIIPTVLGSTASVPQLSANMKGKTITSWGSEDWYEPYTL